MASQTKQRHDVATQSESVGNDTLELAQQSTTVAKATRGAFDAANTETQASTNPEDDRSLHGFGQLWRSHQLDGLALRWQIGASCNEHLSGRKTSRDVATRIGCGLPDLHLMMWFARLVPDLQDFLDKHPSVTSWSKAKEVVTQLNPNPGKHKRSDVGKLIGMIRKLASQHQDGKLAFENKEVATLSAVLLRFALALNPSTSTDASVEENE